MLFKAKKNPEQGQGIWIVKIEKEEWTDLYKKAKTKAYENVTVKGFRKGKAPLNIIEENTSPKKIFTEAYKIGVDKAWEFALAQKSDIEPFSTPEPKPLKINEAEFEVEFVFDLKPMVKIGEYKGITGIKKESFTPTKEEIDAVITQYQEKFVMEKIKEDPDALIAQGDSVKFDFEGFMDGKPFKGGKGLDFVLTIGSKKFIPGFEESMIGKTLGESEIEVTFPKDYQVEELAGKLTNFKLDVKEIKERILPKRDDELAKDLAIKDVNSYKDLESHVKKTISLEKERQLRSAFVNEVIDKVIEKSTIELPKKAINKEVEKLRKEFEHQVIAQNLTMKEYKKATGLSDTDIDNEIFGDAKHRLESYLITDEVVRKEKLEPTEAEVNEKYQDLASKFNLEIEKLRKDYLPEDKVKQEIINEKLIDFLYTNNG